MYVCKGPNSALGSCVPDFQMGQSGIEFAPLSGNNNEVKNVPGCSSALGVTVGLDLISNPGSDWVNHLNLIIFSRGDEYTQLPLQIRLLIYMHLVRTDKKPSQWGRP